jgi:hypothetical protein
VREIGADLAIANADDELVARVRRAQRGPGVEKRTAASVEAGVAVGEESLDGTVIVIPAQAGIQRRL